MGTPTDIRFCPVQNRRPSQPQRPVSGDGGLITLEWLLIVGAIAGLAATSVLTVQRVLDDTSEVPADPLVRMLEADVAAAFIAADAQAAFDEDPTMYTTAVDQTYKDRCDIDFVQDFSDVVEVNGAVWTTPLGPDLMPGTADDVAARCVATPQANLGA